MDGALAARRHVALWVIGYNMQSAAESRHGPAKSLPWRQTARRLEAVHAALDKTERYLVDQLVLTSGMRRARAEHQAILAAFEARDAQLAVRLTREHILGRCGAACESM